MLGAPGGGYVPPTSDRVTGASESLRDRYELIMSVRGDDAEAGLRALSGRFSEMGSEGS